MIFGAMDVFVSKEIPSTRLSVYFFAEFFLGTCHVSIYFFSHQFRVPSNLKRDRATFFERTRNGLKMRFLKFYEKLLAKCFGLFA